MARILRAKQAGGKAYNPPSVAGSINSSGAPRSGSAKDADILRAYAALRAKVRSFRKNESIGSKGNL